MLTEGQSSEYLAADVLIAGFQSHHIIADKGHDPDSFVLAINSTGAEAVVPPRSNRKDMLFHDTESHKECNLVKRLFQKLINYRRIATRHERLARNYAAMMTIV